MKNKFLIFILLLVLSLAVSGCSDKEETITIQRMKKVMMWILPTQKVLKMKSAL
jgi:uncharacterized lipoprotein YehR (DUF1307 family)